MCNQPKRDEESIYVGLSLEIVELKGKEEMQRKCHLDRKCGKLAAMPSTYSFLLQSFGEKNFILLSNLSTLVK